VKKGILFLLVLAFSILLMEGFQCSSPEKTTAKLAIKSGEYLKAKTTIQKELAKNPKDVESLFILAEAHQNLGEYYEAGNVILEAEKNATRNEEKEQIKVFKANLATNCDEKSRYYYNNYLQSQNLKALDSSILLIETGLKLRPERPDFWMIKGLALENKRDTSGAIECYEKFSELMKPELLLAKQKKITLNMPMKEVLKKLEINPERTIPYIVESDTLHIDVIKYGMAPAFLYSIKTPKDKDFMLMGWDVAPPMTWIPQEILVPKEISIRPYLKLVLLYGLTNKLDKAIENINKIFILDPKNETAKDLLLNLYQIQGKTEDAIKYVVTLIEENPNNATYYSILGNLYLQIQDYAKAIDSYNKALKIDPNDLQAIRNLGPAYKNIFVLKQRKQKELRQNDPNIQEITPDMVETLKTSMRYFEKAVSMEEYKNDFDAIADLMEIYTALSENEKIDPLIKKLESLENTIPNDKKYDYYNRMVKIFDRLGNQERFNYYQEQFNKQYK